MISFIAFVISDNFLEHQSTADRNNVTEFIILGLSMDKKLWILCFFFILFCYLAIWLGNLIIVIFITCSQLITQAMYFFLNCLTLSDLFYNSTVTPKLMTDFLMEKKSTSDKICMTQLFTTHFFGGIEVVIFTGRPMTIMWLSVNLSTMPSSWTGKDVTQFS